MGLDRMFKTSLVAGEDLDDAQFHAIAVDDGKLAANAAEATGVLENAPLDGEHMAINYNGEFRFAAGEAISAGDNLGVTNSGWFTAAGLYETSVGQCKADITSGSTGIGYFSFASANGAGQILTYGITPKGSVLTGIAYALDDNNVADNGEETDAVAISAITSGTDAIVGLAGIVSVKVADTTSAGDHLTVATSGYFSIADSGDYVVGKLLANTASGINGLAHFSGLNLGDWGI